MDAWLECFFPNNPVIASNARHYTLRQIIAAPPTVLENICVGVKVLETRRFGRAVALLRGGPLVDRRGRRQPPWHVAVSLLAGDFVAMLVGDDADPLPGPGYYLGRVVELHGECYDQADDSDGGTVDTDPYRRDDFVLFVDRLEELNDEGEFASRGLYNANVGRAFWKLEAGDLPLDAVVDGRLGYKLDPRVRDKLTRNMAEARSAAV